MGAEETTFCDLCGCEVLLKDSIECMGCNQVFCLDCGCEDCRPEDQENGM